MQPDGARSSHRFHSSEICGRSHDVHVKVKLGRKTVTHGSHNSLRRDHVLVQVVFSSEHLFNLVNGDNSWDSITGTVVSRVDAMV
jgi:hypothetical protein